MLLCVVGDVCGVTQLHDVVYIVCQWSSAIRRFSATTHQRLADINVTGLRYPRDIVACQQTSQLYVADCPMSSTDACVWRVSSDGADIKRWLTKSPSGTFTPWTLSVTATRLLVTSHYTKQLMQFDADGNELRRVHLPKYVTTTEHAVESPTETFIVGHHNIQLKQRQVSEVNTEGEVLRQFSGPLGCTPHVAVDSQGNMFVADFGNRRILLLDDQLALRRVIIDKHQLNDKPWRLCYIEHSGQLLVVLDSSCSVAVFDVLHR